MAAVLLAELTSDESRKKYKMVGWSLQEAERYFVQKLVQTWKCAQFLGGQKFRKLICLSALSPVATGNSNISGISLFRMALFDPILSLCLLVHYQQGHSFLDLGTWVVKSSREMFFDLHQFLALGSQKPFWNLLFKVYVLVFNATHSEISQGLSELHNTATVNALCACGHTFEFQPNSGMQKKACPQKFMMQRNQIQSVPTWRQNCLELGDKLQIQEGHCYMCKVWSPWCRHKTSLFLSPLL